MDFPGPDGGIDAVLFPVSIAAFHIGASPPFPADAVRRGIVVVLTVLIQHFIPHCGNAEGRLILHPDVGSVRIAIAVRLRLSKHASGIHREHHADLKAVGIRYIFQIYLKIHFFNRLINDDAQHRRANDGV